MSPGSVLSNGVVVDAAALPPPPELERVALLVREQRTASVGNVWGAAQPFVLAALSAHTDLGARPLLVVASTDGEAEAFAADLAAFGAPSVPFPAREAGSTRKGVDASADAAAVRARLSLAQALAGPPEARPRVVVASMQALLQPLPALRELENEFVRLRVGEVLDAQRLLARLVRAGYVRQPLAEQAGEVSLRGDILDVFPFASPEPLRVELFDDEVESLRTFDPETQRSTGEHDALEVCLAGPGELDGAEGVLLPALLPDDTVFVRVEPLRVGEKAEALAIRLPSNERALKLLRPQFDSLARLDLQSLPGDDLSLDTRTVQGLSGGVDATAPELARLAAEGTRVVVLCATEAERDRVSTRLAEGGAGAVECAVGVVSRGFRAPPWSLLVVGSHELKGTIGARRKAVAREHRHRVRALQSFFELKPGDLVVHAVHGLARYRGLERMERAGGEEEHLHLVFADSVSLYVPASRIDMVQRYIGAGGAAVPLDKIGGAAFRKRKERVERGLFDLAAELIDVQAKRQLRKRPPWEGDEDLVDQFLAEWPHEDTADQAEVSRDVTADLASERPMDRLLCGDVGFGKTEIAVRAAFRVVNAGGQVAVLVPTTVLAEQHLETFRARTADFPVTVRGLSRTTPPKERRDTIEGLRSGRVDVVVGTHRVLSKDVSFARLGLVVIDEEQRFGVTHKEHFKRLRANVDLLTLTATPIPRTLHMSLSGIRDISALTVPPPGRQAIETVIGYGDDDELIVDAVRRELERGGQVFFLHNRVRSIEAVAARLRRLVPDATYAIGHGQMPARDLHEVMRSVTRGEADVLVATTIIENGVDIPAAGTILIDDADRFGLSELHQLRGRVGRGAQKAWCYLLVERHKPLKPHARERLKALEELNHLGAGFGISVKDLELRGAGNVLGAQQSGHIAAVGYDMYCRLLKLAIDRLQAGEATEDEHPRWEETETGCELELGVRAFLPEAWIATPDERLDALRRLSECHDDEEVEAVGASLRDRYGRVPPEARVLLRVFRLKLRLDPAGLRHVAWKSDRYVVRYTDRVGFETLFAGRELDLRMIKPGVAHLVTPTRLQGRADKAMEWLEGIARDATPHDVRA